ncbi:hypothetical protein K2173_013965 [Erythroxylum novogranatense]|uniref:Peptidase A1 domain-containing protein n=1 Tax=Erythroxylum novogranatense TaxID=1862640 RepID=A0AAV8SDD8_9ROSI|nr:hypothetical protein K2173_013965 [Erythroxylum novogranatense]
MDTGSSLLWIKCLPCTPCSQNSGSIYNPYKSSTYSTLSCKDFYYCKYCNSFNQCLYNITYVEGPSSSGILSTERLTFEAPDDGKFVLSDVVFGCGHKTQNFVDEHFKGVFGLGNRAKASLLKQMGSKFSYCIGDVRDPYYNFNHLIIGDSARLEGFSTPVKIINGLYYLTLVGISVGGNMLDINASTFQKTPGVNNGVIIDSGTELTFLAKKGFEIIIKEIHLLSEGLLTRDEEYSSQELCYKGIVTQVAQGFPVLTFHFADGADLILDIMSMFIQVNPNAFCLGIAPSDGITSSGSLSIIGMLAQQYYNVGYDLNASKMYFQRIDCELLED